MKKALATVRAFTLIELLVVIAIIALLTGIVLTSLTGSKAKARDAQRVSDVSQLQLALELYFDRCHSYPLSDNGVIDQNVLISACPSISGVNLGLYISKVPIPPTGGTYDYITNYSASPSVNPPTDYVLHTTLESGSAVSTNSLGSNKPGYASSITCDTNLNYCVGPK